MKHFISLIIVLLCCCLSVFSQNTQTLLPIVKDGKWGFIDTKGAIVIQPTYDKVGKFINNKACVQKDQLYYIIDSTGNSVFKEGYIDIQRINDDYVALKKDLFALANVDGTIYSAFDYSLITQQLFHTLVLKKQLPLYSLFNQSAKKLLTEDFDSVCFDKKEYCIAIKKNNKAGILDTNLQFILEPKGGKMAMLKNGLAIVQTLDYDEFYIDNGKVDIDTMLMKSYEVLSKYFILTWNNPHDKYIISTKNIFKFPISYKYKYLALNKELFTFNNGTLMGIINSKGETIQPMEYQSIELLPDNYIKVIKNGKHGILSREGVVILKPQFDEIEAFNKNGIALVLNASQWGIVQQNGKILLPCQYTDIELSDESWKCYKNHGMDLYNLSTPVTVEEMIKFNNVGSIRVRKGIQRSYNFGRVMNSSDFVKDGIKRYSGRYKLTSENMYYAKSSKMKTLLPNFSERVNRVYGIYDTLNHKTLVRNMYWDIELHEFENQEFCRIILPGDRQALFSKKGQIMSLFPVSKVGSKKNGTAVYIGPFKHGLARINIGGTYAVGNDIDEPTFRTTFSNLNLDCNGGTWGFVNGNAEVAIGIRYEYVSDFVNGKSIVKINGKYGVIDTLEQIVIQPQYDLITYLEDSDNQYFKLVYNKTDWGVISTEGKVLMEANYEKIGTINENRIPVKNSGKWGVFNYAGSQIIPFKYDYMTAFNEGIAAYKVKSKWGFIDSSGQMIKEALYAEAKAFHDGYAAVKTKDGWGYIDASGNEVIKPQYVKGNDFYSGSAAVYEKKKWHFIDSTNKTVFYKKFRKTTEFNEIGFAKVAKGKKWYLFDESTGKLLPSVKYKNIFAFSDGMAAVQNKAGQYGFIDTTGKLVVPMVYERAGNFSEGFAKVKLKRGKWGYINKMNVLKIGYFYKTANDFHEGKTVVCEAKKTFVLDTAGRILFELPETETGFYQDHMLLIKSTYYNEQGKKEMGPFSKASPIKNNVAIVETYELGKSSNQMIDRKYNILASYKFISTPKDNVSSFQISNLYGIADANGKIIVKSDYQEIKSIGDGVFQIKDFDKMGYLNDKGVWIWQPTR